MKSTNEHIHTIGHHTEPIIIHVAKNGTDLGKIKLSSVQCMLTSGELVCTDHYFEPSAQEWMPLSSHPELG